MTTQTASTVVPSATSPFTLSLSTLVTHGEERGGEDLHVAVRVEGDSTPPTLDGELFAGVWAAWLVGAVGQPGDGQVAVFESRVISTPTDVYEFALDEDLEVFRGQVEQVVLDSGNWNYNLKSRAWVCTGQIFVDGNAD